ncbi:MAG TPA: hypothetical protein VHD31_01005 [Candidatus Paceibacterota bacterium]|nr:hypothetical protein [Candidatus Paceibacterota bacterium]
MEGGQNLHSVRVIDAMEWIISTQLEEKPYLRGILCSKLHSESQMHSIPLNSVAIFDGYVNRRFSFLAPSHNKGAPAWSKSSSWAIVVGPQAGEKGDYIRSCAFNAVANFARHFEDRLAAGHYPWGERRTGPRHRGGKQQRLKKQMKEAGGPGGWPSL